MSQPTPALDEGEERVQFPGARPPDRVRSVDSDGVRIAVHEWGDRNASPLLLAHGGFDFARTYDVFAPLLAEAGWRVVSWDQRGHGDSEHAMLYSWEADVRDAHAVLRSTSDRPLPAVGHSKGAGVLMSLIEVAPDRFTRFAALDGLPWKVPRPDVAEHEHTRILARTLSDWLDHRRRSATAVRKPGSLDELAARRGRMNPRLDHAWLRHLVSVGARRDPDGWRWKIDPTLRFGGFGPWEPAWTLARLSRLRLPLYGILATETEEMGVGATVENLTPYLPPGARLEALEGAGHFVHIERPREVADRVLAFLSE